MSDIEQNPTLISSEKEEKIKDSDNEEEEIEEEKKEKQKTEKIILEFPIDGDLNANCTLTRTTNTKKDSKEYLISVEIILTKDENIQFHWGLFRYPHLGNWVAPPKSYYPKEETNPCDENSTNTNFL